MVQRRDTGRGHSPEYFPICNRRFWKFDELQPFITTKCFGSHCTHIISPLIQAFIPPSTVRLAPVMYEDSGPATNATSAATSSTCPKRSSAVAAFCGTAHSLAAGLSSVAIGPRLTMLTVMFLFVASLVSGFGNIFTAPFVAPEAPRPR